MKFTIEEINEKYDLELEKVLAEIQRQKAKLVLLQFPDGLKIYATAIVDYLESRLKLAPLPRGMTEGLGVHQNTECRCKFLIWFGSCYGACDTPILGDIEKSVDLVIQFGHNEILPSY